MCAESRFMLLIHDATAGVVSAGSSQRMESLRVSEWIWVACPVPTFAGVRLLEFCFWSMSLMRLCWVSGVMRSGKIP